RSRCKALGIDPEHISRQDFHIHVPAGAIPKDGPSAGVAMLTALVSLLSGQTVDPLTGMTGEITLRGSVLPIGGLKEKVLAAHRAGVTRVIIPHRNAKDLEEIPEEVRADIEFVLIKTIDDLLRAVFKYEPSKPAKKRSRAATKSRAKTRSKASSKTRRKTAAKDSKKKTANRMAAHPSAR
ncbi:MAG: hypothetical protein GY842_20765, partial [bacterium]|nr:hypothetical protein [bacterium]